MVRKNSRRPVQASAAVDRRLPAGVRGLQKLQKLQKFGLDCTPWLRQ